MEMNEHTPAEAGQDPPNGAVTQEPDWSQSAWFKTWLKLARKEPEPKPPAPTPKPPST